MIVLSDKVIVALRALGIDTNMVRRVVIDLQAGHAVVIHIERFGDDRILEVVRALEGVEVRFVTPDAGPSS